jgi:ATP-dependent helicase/nuclease subunit A
MTLSDHAARQRIAEDLDSTLVVEAAAGTGKTTALVGRIVAVVAQGHRQATLGKIIAVTFTQKAAGEMKLRLRQALEDARGEAPAGSAEHARLEHALSELEVARIATIHEVCADLLREHPVAAGVDPLFEVAADDDSSALLTAAFDGWFPQTLRNPPEGIRRLLRRRSRRREQMPPRELLRSAAWKLIEHRDFDRPWRRDPFDREGQLVQLLSPLRELAALAPLGAEDDYLRGNFAEIRRFIEDLDHREAVAPRDFDGLEAALSELSRHRSWTYKGWGPDYARGFPRPEVISRRDAVKEQLVALLARSDADLAACLHRELLPVVKAYEAVKARSGKLDFFDLLLRLRDLLRRDPAVRGDLQGRFTHLFVDEFQDTDPLQADILRLLAASDPDQTDPERAIPVAGKLFIVGDPKQSIYRFRRADVTLYERVKQSLLASGASLLDLTTSFRAAPFVQQAVNAAFAPQMGTGTQTQARYVPLTRYREPIAGQPSLVALPVPRPYAHYGKITNQSIDESYPDAVGAFIDHLIRKSGWKVLESGSDTAVPVQPQHICILFKRFKGWEGADVTLRYTRALEARRIPHVLVGGRSFHAREEVLALRNALTAVEWPDDELAVYATLRGPLFALSDDALLTFKTASGKLHPLRPLKPEELVPAAQEVAEGLAVLKALHSGRNRRPIADTLSQLLEATRAHAGVAFWTAGDQALANLAQLTDLARRFEASGGRSFRAFVDRLHAEADSGTASEAPIVEEGSEGVRVMTVHGAKGLEFPVVILADPTAPHAGRRNPSHWLDPETKLWAESLAGCSPVELLENSEEVLRREREESIRLVYVAATRARDLLVVPVVGHGPQEGWVDVLHPVLYPKPDEVRTPRAAPGCPTFSSESVIDLPERAPNIPSVVPGLHRPQLGSHEVVWWDPRALELDKTHNTGLQQDEVLREDADGSNAAAGLAGFEAWKLERERILNQGRQPSMRVIAAASAEGQPLEPIAHELTDCVRAGRPGGRRFGALVHAALAEVSLAAAPEEIDRLVALKGRAIGSAVDELRAANEAVACALRHPLFLAAAKSSQVRRECPISFQLLDGTVAEGVIDLAFHDGTHWVVIDFKTDAELEGHRAEYEAQVSIYVNAISQSTGAPTRGVLLSV